MKQMYRITVYLKVKLESQEKESLWRLYVGLLHNKSYVEDIKMKRILVRFTPLFCKMLSKQSSKGSLQPRQYLFKKRKKQPIRKKRKNCLNLNSNIRNYRDNIDKLLTTEIERKARFLKQSYYEVGPRATRLLAKRLKKQQAERTVHKIMDTLTNKITYEPKEIKTIFRNYYGKLCSQPPSADVDQMRAFLKTLDLRIVEKHFTHYRNKKQRRQ